MLTEARLLLYLLVRGLQRLLAGFPAYRMHHGSPTRLGNLDPLHLSRLLLALFIDGYRPLDALREYSIMFPLITDEQPLMVEMLRR